ncbi:hypothetical protein WJX82_003552 [Trebouxia sp. C0006]
MFSGTNLGARSNRAVVGSQASLVTVKPAVTQTLAIQCRSGSRRSTPGGLKRWAAVTALEDSSLHLVSSEEYDDGTVLFCFGDEPTNETELEKTSDAKLEELTVEMPVASTAQHSEEGQAHTSAKEQDVMAAEEHKADEPGSSSDKLQQTVASQTQQTTASQSEQQQNEPSISSADTSDEEASGSDSGSERLAEMTPQQLEGLKVTELKDLCKQERVKGYSKLKKDQLIILLQEQMQSR